jgi:hypothetical protein
MLTVLYVCLIGGLVGCFAALFALHYTGIFLHDSKEKFEAIAQEALERATLEQALKEKEETEKKEKAERKKRRNIYDPYDPSL